jgi:membrane-bound lytic murein transglycosylase F
MRELSRSVRKTLHRLALIASLSAFVAYISSSAHMSDLERVHARGQLVMLTIPGPTTYFEDGHGKNGFDYIIAKAFADSLNVDLVVKPQPTLRKLLLSVGGPQGDFAAANLVGHRGAHQIVTILPTLFRSHPTVDLSPRQQAA